MNNDQLQRKHTFTIVPDSVIDDTELSKYAKIAYLCIARFAGKDRTAFPSTRKLAEISNCGRRQLCLGIEELIEKGYLEKHQRSVDGKKAKTSNLYILSDIPGSYTDPRGSNTDPGWVLCGPRGGSYEEQEVETLEVETIKKKVTHPSLDVPMNETRYKNLCDKHGKETVDSYIRRAIDYCDAKGRKYYADFAAAAANYIARDAGNPGKENADEAYREAII